MTNTPQMPQHIHPAFQKAQTTAAEQSSRALDRSTDAVDYWMTQHRNDAPMVLIAGSTKRHTGGQADLLLSLQQRSPSGMHDLIAIAAEGLAERIEHFDQPTTDCA